MNLTKIKVTGLFGTFNHVIQFKTKENITLIHGQNGLGKTVLLRMLKAFFDLNFEELNNQIFDNFILYFPKRTEVRIKRGVKHGIAELKIEKVVAGKKIGSVYSPRQIENRRIRTKTASSHGIIYQREIFEDKFMYHEELDYIVRQYIPEPLKAIEPGIWYSHRMGRMMDSSELIDRYRKYIPTEFFNRVQTPDWLKELATSQKTSIIETQRLLNKIKSEDGKYRSTVVDYSKETIERIKTKRAEASDLASKLDRTYPNRLIEKLRNQETISNQELKNKLIALEGKRQLLNFAGITDTEETYIQPDTIQDNLIKNVLQLYVEDSNEKLSVYNELSEKIFLFLEIINRRFLYKKLSIDKQIGFKFTSTINKNSDVPLTGLSSGEQHELVLFYHLLFNTEPGSLLLIDEPEISLHISWQKSFINDLKEIIKLNSVEIIIATHSPDLIGKYWDLTVELKGIERK